MILVIGATGKVGSELVTQLQANDLPFRALAHSLASRERLQAQGVAVVTADDTRPASLAPAFADVERLFLLTPSSPDQATIEGRYLNAARAAGVRHVVKLSVFAVDDPDVSLLGAHRQSEAAVRASGLTYTFLRPNAFMQNFAAIDAPLIKQQRAIFNSAGDGRISFIDARDIAAVALEALRDDRHLGQTYNLTGPEALTYAEVAERLSALLGYRVQYVPLDDAAYEGALRGAQLPEWYAAGLAELYRFYREQKGAGMSEAVEQITGRPARRLDAYLAEQRAAFA